MSNDGKQLEGLVSFVESVLLPHGFEVKSNKCIYNEDGVQIAEFDIQIHGKMGSTVIDWLIECRDRPGSGPAPGSWIEQLVGRRTRFKFNKITAVSTTGFSAGAIDFARVEKIELREVRTLTPDQFSDWIRLDKMTYTEIITKLEHADIMLGNGETPEHLEMVRDILSRNNTDTNLFRSILRNEPVSLANIFLAVVNSNQTFIEGIEPNGPGRKVSIHAVYPNDDDHFVLDTDSGPVRVGEIHFQGELIVKELLVPLITTAEYRDTESGNQISQVAAFAPHDVQGMQLSVEMHRIAESGQTHLIVRRLGSDT